MWRWRSQYVKTISQFGVILALLLTMGAVTQEKNRGTAAMMLVKPLPRSTFLLAKFGALALMFALTIAVAGAACYYLTLLGAIPGLGDYLPGHLLAWGSEMMMDGSATAWPALGISLALIGVALVGASLVFARQEL